MTFPILLEEFRKCGIRYRSNQIKEPLESSSKYDTLKLSEVVSATENSFDEIYEAPFPNDAAL